MEELKFNRAPHFNVDAHGKSSTVVLEVKTYIRLLVWATVTNLELWPPGFKEGAAALERVRQIESDCTAQEGEFDWEKLPADIQDEYDGLCISLDSLQEVGGNTTWQGYKSRPGEDQG